VIDPLEINKNSFKKIIDALIPNSCPEEYSYIVYNKSFEQTRLNEMANYINEPEYTEKVKIIVENIYDLADLFNPEKTDFFICFKELGGFYSIKKVLPLVYKYKPKIFERTKCRDYHSLKEVQNGTQAQNASGKRFFKKINDIR